jgi:hypothetical protein
MVVRSKIIDLGRSSDGTASQDEALIVNETDHGVENLYRDEAVTNDLDAIEWHDSDELPPRNWPTIALIALLSATAATWTGFFIWAHLSELRSIPTPVRISELVVSWSVPAALVGVCWLIAMRMSQREARRFGDAALKLRIESEQLEQRMRRVNGEISLARSFLAENARELESVGRMSAQRLTEAADTLSHALGDADEKARMLEATSNAAVVNLEQLRNHLPVVSSAAKDATNQIGIAGNSAHAQIQGILATLHQVSEKTATTNDAMTALGNHLSKSAVDLESRLTIAAARLQASVDNSRTAAKPMFDSFEKNITKIERRLSDATINVDRRIGESEKQLDAILASMQAACERLSATVTQQDKASATAVARLSELIDKSRESLSELDSDATDRIAKLAFAVSVLVEKNGELSGALEGNRLHSGELIKTSQELIDQLERIAADAGGVVPEAIGKIAEQFEANRTIVAALTDEIEIADRGTIALSERIADIKALVADQQDAVESLSAATDSALGHRHEQLDALSVALTQTRSLIDDMVETANGQLVASLLRVRETTRQAAESSRKIVEDELGEIVGSISERNKDALAAAVAEQVQAMDAAMQDALQRNLTLSDAIDARIHDQLGQLQDMVGNLEQRIAQAHGSFGGIDDEGFARRIALLTESLNSASIDVAKILSNDVTDTAWAAYLKGDRGVFTRRAVRLLDTGEAKAVAAHYDDDAEFRENVNRYIHDFEAMMRVLLSTRDGNAIGVTILSSDVGKLYVALAQAIERLRN